MREKGSQKANSPDCYQSYSMGLFKAEPSLKKGSITACDKLEVCHQYKVTQVLCSELLPEHYSTLLYKT